MSYFDKEQQKNIEILKTIMVREDLEKFSYADEIIAYYAAKYDNTDLTNNEILQGCIFNWLSEDDVVDFLKETYGLKFEEVVRYRRIK